MGPILELLKDGDIFTNTQVIEQVSNKFDKDEEDEKTFVSNGLTKYADRIYWALTNLKKAGLIERPERAKYKITNEGKEIFLKKGINIDIKDLEHYAEYREFKLIHRDKESKETNQQLDTLTINELIDYLIPLNHNKAQDELLSRLHKMNPFSFEKICVKVICNLYKLDELVFGLTTQKTRDGGIDGVISLDQLGLDKVYIQAKRFTPTVRATVVRNFLGTLKEARASKSVIITTSDFAGDAENLAKEHNIKLIDGKEFASLMIKCRVGIDIEKTIEIYKISEDFFEEMNE
ncbi:MAG: restriction endonuclease [Mycoplasmataceae bacterium]|jgi:restriction system protein|nr:restriction endonuclease [Mycoplasmataceae bacterium]